MRHASERRNTQRVIARRQHLGAQVLATFTSGTERLHHLLSGRGLAGGWGRAGAHRHAHTDRGAHILKGLPGEWRLFTPDGPRASTPTSH